MLCRGNLGGMNWSGYAFDPQRNLLIVNTNNLIARVRLIPRDKVDSDNEDGEYGPQHGTPYAMIRRFLQSPSDLPCGAPPWGTLTAIDMARGTTRWRVPFGTMQNFGGLHNSVPPGSISLGGPISGNATPMTYAVNGKQYLVIAAGGHQRIPEEPLGDALVAFALP